MKLINNLIFKLTVAFIASGFTCHSFAQGLYVGIGGGYGFAADKQDLGQNITTAPGTTTYASNSFSLGKGTSIGVYGGYLFNKNIGAELGAAYLIGNTTSTTEESLDASSIITLKSTHSLKGSMLRLAPSMRIQYGEKRLHPFVTAGLIIGLGSQITEEYYTLRGTDLNDNMATYSGGISLGFHASAGIQFNLTDRVGIYGELSGNFQSYAPKKMIYTKFLAHGVDELPGMTVSQKETDFQNNYTAGTNSPGTPSSSTLVHFPFSSVGLNIGLHYSFGKSK
ncbi:MAG: outer membrane beta-barrel protein [Bacteroidia bacterium]